MADREQTRPQVLLSAGRVDDGYLPKPRTQTHDWYRKVRQMRKDPTVALARQLSIAPIIAASWSYESAEGAAPGSRDFIEKQIKPLRLGFLRACFLGCVDFGWQTFEKVKCVNDDGWTRLRKLKPLLPDVTEIIVDADTGSFVGVRQHQRSHYDEVFLGLDEVLLTNIDVEGTDWYGQGLMEIVETAYDPWVKSNAGATRYDEKLAGSHWVIHYPQGTSMVEGKETDNYTIANRIISRLESSGCIAVPKTVAEHVADLNASTPDAWKIEMLTDSGGQAGYTERMRYLDSLKARAFGLPERAVLEGQFGTKAEAEAHADLAITNMEMRHSIVVQQFNLGVVNDLLRTNYGPDYEDSVYVSPMPIADLEKQYLRKLYADVFMKDPNVVLSEMGRIDMEQMRDRLGVPTVPMPDMTYFAPEVTDDQSGIPALPVLPEQVEGYAEPVVEEPVPVAAAYDPNQPREEDGKFGSGGGDDLTPDWSNSSKQVHTSQFNDVDAAKEAFKQASKALKSAGFEQEARDAKHVASAKMGRSKARSGSSDKVEVQLRHADGRTARLKARYVRLGTSSVSVWHGESKEPDDAV